MLTILAFLVAIAVLVAVHEWGHFQMARSCGVKVLKFSVGFGPRLMGWVSPKSGTEYAISWIPLGGYVRMLDESEGAVAANEQHLAFNRQPLGKRAAIVAAGPTANLLLAILLYAVVYWAGVMEPVARISNPPPGSLMANAGLKGGDTVLRLATEGDRAIPVESFEDLRWRIARAALDGVDIRLEYLTAENLGQPRRVSEAEIPLSRLDVREADATLLKSVGIVAPYSPALIGEIVPGSAAQAAGLKPGDRILSVDQVPISEGAELRQLIRASGSSGKSAEQHWVLTRDGQEMSLKLLPKVETEGGTTIGRIGAVVGAAPEMVKVRSGVFDSFEKSVKRTWEVSELTLRMMGRIVIGEASLKNISGPVTIADYAGRSASLGLVQFLQFLALISVSLGVLNLLPLPVLDGGHLMYYLWELVTGRAVSESWQALLQRTGMAVLMLMMSVAIYNDLSRLLQ